MKKWRLLALRGWSDSNVIVYASHIDVTRNGDLIFTHQGRIILIVSRDSWIKVEPVDDLQ